MCLSTSVCSEKYIVTLLHHCVNITECNYTNGDSYDVTRCCNSMELQLHTQSIASDQNMGSWYMAVRNKKLKLVYFQNKVFNLTVVKNYH